MITVNGDVSFSVRTNCQYKNECDVESECECERCGLCGKHVDMMVGKKERSGEPVRLEYKYARG
jgi:hypothetical protein